MIFDTCFFIDHQRGRKNTTDFLEANDGEELFLTVINVGELAAGFEREELPKLWERLHHFRILNVDVDCSKKYAEIYRLLRERGNLIGANDLWIASIALTNRQPVVTNNLQEFMRVPGLQVISY